MFLLLIYAIIPQHHTNENATEASCHPSSYVKHLLEMRKPSIPPGTCNTIDHHTRVQRTLETLERPTHAKNQTPPSLLPPRPDAAPTLHATRPTPHGALRLVQEVSACSVKTRCAPSWYCKDGRVYAYTTTVMHDMSTPRPPPAPRQRPVPRTLSPTTRMSPPRLHPTLTSRYNSSPAGD